MHTDLCSMRLINIKAFLGGEQMMSWGEKVDRRTKVLGFCDDEASKYAILSHRRSDTTKVDFEEMVNLARLDVEESDEIRGVLGYKKILDSCEQATKDGYEWLWIETCCIDKYSSVELSEATNSIMKTLVYAMRTSMTSPTTFSYSERHDGVPRFWQVDSTGDGSAKGGPSNFSTRTRNPIGGRSRKRYICGRGYKTL